MAVLHTGDLFSSIEEARDLINRSVLDKGELYKVRQFTNTDPTFVKI
jgi:hypothetical protein